MVGLRSIAVLSICIVGAIYSVLILGNCLARQRGAHTTHHGARRAGRRKSRSARIDWWCEAISAATFLAVAATLLVVTWHGSEPAEDRHDRHTEKHLPQVHVPDVLTVARDKLERYQDRPGQPIWGANLAFLPVTDADIHALMNVGTEIEYLILTGTEVTDEGLVHVRQMPRLKTLGLAGTQVSDLGCKELAQIETLAELSLADTAITDEGVKHLSRLTNLQSLNLQSTAISDTGLRSLGKLPQLESLDISATNVTDDGIRGLKERMLHPVYVEVFGRSN
jgi:Leucine Rich Repeat (LRR) protein